MVEIKKGNGKGKYAGIYGIFVDLSAVVVNAFGPDNRPYPIPRVVKNTDGNLIRFNVSVSEKLGRGNPLVYNCFCRGDLAKRVQKMKLKMGSHVQIHGEMVIEDIGERCVQSIRVTDIDYQK